MNALTVLYDGHCGLCRRARDWLLAQPQWTPLVFVSAGSAEARRRYPQLDHDRTLEQLTVVDDAGGVYQGLSGWLMCLYALRDYRELSFTLATPLGRPFARAGIWLANRLRRRTACDGQCGL